VALERRIFYTTPRRISTRIFAFSLLPPPALFGIFPAMHTFTRRALRNALLLLLLIAPLTCADEPLAKRQWNVENVTREALVYVPATTKTNPTPVVFAFHGHGGTMNNAARTFAYHIHWPEAIVVYPQGLNTPGRLTDPNGKLPGWQSAPGDQGDRDLKFFDAILATLHQEYKVDDKRIYATGHSNGGGFTYLLWAARGDKFAAVAPSSAVAPRLLAELKPKPVFHLAGEHDELVKFSWQKLTIDALLKRNQCGEGRPWGDIKFCTLYPSKLDTPVVTFIHPGGHTFPKEAPAAIVKFFQQHAKP
jgi:polyhydroxybutyrate depolymerase